MARTSLAVSAKRRRQILNAINAAAFAATEEFVPECIGKGAPETWTREDREKFDLITDLEIRITRAVEGALLK